jgi:hypothetical protein
VEIVGMLSDANRRRTGSTRFDERARVRPNRGSGGPAGGCRSRVGAVISKFPFFGNFPRVPRRPGDLSGTILPVPTERTSKTNSRTLSGRIFVAGGVGPGNPRAGSRARENTPWKSAAKRSRENPRVPRHGLPVPQGPFSEGPGFREIVMWSARQKA